MSRIPALFFLAALAVIAISAPASAAGHGGRNWHKDAGALRRKLTPVVPAPAPNPEDAKDQGDNGAADDPLDWMTDFDAAAKLAADEKRPLMVLFTNENAERTAPSCHFATKPTRQAVRDCKAVPVKLLPPQPLINPELLGAEEVKKRNAEFEKARERFEALVKRFAVSKVPSLMLAAPDADKLEMMVAPSDDDVCDRLAKLPDAVREHVAADSKAEVEKNKPAEGKDVKVADAPKPADPPAGPKAPRSGDEEDF